MTQSNRVRIKYWHQETPESGRWCISGLTSIKTAKKVIDANIYENSSIVVDEEGFPEWKDEN